MAAILAKTIRLNKLMNAGHRIRRVEIKAKDVMKPFIVLVAINVAMLLGISFIAPFEFRRTQLDNYDAFGRSVETYGACRPSSNLVLVFLIPLIVTDIVGVALAGWQCYVARHLPMDFSETHYLGISMAILTETIILSSPVLVALSNQPTAYYIFATAAICFLSLSILVPVFLPKWIHRNQKANLGRAQANMIAQAQQKGQRRGLGATTSTSDQHTFRTRPSTFNNQSTFHSHPSSRPSTFHGPSRINSTVMAILAETYGDEPDGLSECSSHHSRASGYMKIHRNK